MKREETKALKALNEIAEHSYFVNIKYTPHGEFYSVGYFFHREEIIIGSGFYVKNNNLLSLLERQIENINDKALISEGELFRQVQILSENKVALSTNDDNSVNVLIDGRVYRDSLTNAMLYSVLLDLRDVYNKAMEAKERENTPPAFNSVISEEYQKHNVIELLGKFRKKFPKHEILLASFDPLKQVISDSKGNIITEELTTEELAEYLKKKLNE